MSPSRSKHVEEEACRVAAGVADRRSPPPWAEPPTPKACLRGSPKDIVALRRALGPAELASVSRGSLHRPGHPLPLAGRWRVTGGGEPAQPYMHLPVLQSSSEPDTEEYGACRTADLVREDFCVSQNTCTALRCAAVIQTPQSFLHCES
jgi:hypothetical protein